ncbi:MAG: DsbA family protein [Polyangiaceae bacterium]
MRSRNRASIIVALALASQGCSHAVSTGSGPDPAAASPVGQTGQDTAPSGAPAPRAVDIYRVPIDGLPSIGNPDAPVTIVEFTDYQCPYCQRAEQTIAKLRATYGDALRVVIAERPLPFHDRARPAALAALAADAQGKFEAMHTHLFALGGALADGSIVAAAQAAGLDLTRFESDRNNAPLAPSEQLADHIGVSGTPTFFVSGRRVVGAQTYETFRDVVEERLVAARALVATGVRPRDVYAGLTANGLDHVVADAKEAKDDGAGCGAKDCNDGPDDSPTGDAVEPVPVDGAPARGPSRASITIVSFGDFQCPYSAKAEATLRALETAHPGDVRIVFKNLPLPMHSQARVAARAALAADEQGHFWDFHDRLYAHAGAPLDRAGLDKIAADVGLDAARFASDIDDPKIVARLARDEADAATLHVKGTPTFFVNGHRVVGAQPIAAFEAAIAKR